MRTVERYLCDNCDEIIEPEFGYIFEGNVFLVVENLNRTGGLIGNNITEKEIKKNVYCKKCLLEILHITD